MLDNVKELAKAVDAASVALLHENGRGHLGPSQLGGKCAREPWYDFRNVTPPGDPNPAMARLLNRGHEEEHRIMRWLRGLTDVKIRDYAQRLLYHEESDSYYCVPWDSQDWGESQSMECGDVSSSAFHIQRATALGQGPRQWGFSTHGGHHRGSCDGKITGLEQFIPSATGWGLLECKTSNEKSFTKLAGSKGKWNFNKGGLEPRIFDPKKNGLWNAKPEHFKQMQQYMRHLGISWGLYTAVNKETDEIYYEFVEAVPEWGERLNDNAKGTIEARQPPPRMSNDPSFFGCGLCPHKEVCHYSATPVKSCRSCGFVEALTDRDGAKWFCHMHRQEIPDDFVVQGCGDWVAVE